MMVAVIFWPDVVCNNSAVKWFHSKGHAKHNFSFSHILFAQFLFRIYSYPDVVRVVGILSLIEKGLAIDLAIPQMISRRSFSMNAAISLIIFVQSPD